MTTPAKVGELRGAEYNPRKISDAQLAGLKASLEKFGDLSGIVRNKRSGNLVGGHQRVKALDPSWPIRDGFIETPWGKMVYREVDWDEQTEKAANLAANKHGGEWDLPKLKELLVGLDDGSGILAMTGFDEKELAFLIDRGAEVELPELSGDGAPLFEQITFVLSKEQAAVVRAALELASREPFEGTGNENRNGNAIARIAGAYRG